jgi:sugar phosphate isomerase/epimerase
MDMTRVSCCTIPLISRPLGEAMDIIAEAGFEKIDLLGRIPHLSLDPDECDPAAVKAMADEKGLQIANLGTYVGRAFASDDPALREQELGQMRRAIDLAVFFGARSIRVTAGNDDPACIDQIVPRFQRSAEYAAQHQIYMGVENHGGGINGNPERFAELADKIGSPLFGALYEPYNLAAHGVDYREALDIMRDHIVHTHFKAGRRTNGGYELTMMGEGDIDFVWVTEQLDELGYDGDWALEFELRTVSPDTGLKKWYTAFEAMGG